MLKYIAFYTIHTALTTFSIMMKKFTAVVVGSLGIAFACLFNGCKDDKVEDEPPRCRAIPKIRFYADSIDLDNVCVTQTMAPSTDPNVEDENYRYFNKALCEARNCAFGEWGGKDQLDHYYNCSDKGEQARGEGTKPYDCGYAHTLWAPNATSGDPGSDVCCNAADFY